MAELRRVALVSDVPEGQARRFVIDGCEVAVVNLGEDADTTGAVYGQIAGAYYGADGIPSEWREKLAMRDLIEQRAAELHAMSGL